MKRIEPIGIIGYEFDELGEDAQNRAIEEHINFWMEAKEYNSEHPGNFERAINKARELKTPWFEGNFIYEYCKDEIIEEMKQNDYLFAENGYLLPICYHSDGIFYKIAEQEIRVTLV